MKLFFRKKLLYLLVLCTLFFVLNVFTNTASSSEIDTSQSDAIAIRIVPNPNNYDINRWYRLQGFTGSPQALIVDGYKAIRDGRTVYVAAANVDLDNNNIYYNIYLISYNQEADSSTVDIFSRVLQNWKFNSNLLAQEDGAYGLCNISTKSCKEDSDCPSGYLCSGLKVVNGSPVFVGPSSSETNKCVIAEPEGDYINAMETPYCILDSQCPNDLFCSSNKAKLIRDMERIQRVSLVYDKIEEYKNVNGTYPILASGTYLPHIALSSWPSWNNVFLRQIGLSNTLDPINRLGNCNDPAYNFNLDTCWDESSTRFTSINAGGNAVAWNNFYIPAYSDVLIYTANPSGTNASLWTGLEFSSDFTLPMDTNFNDTSDIEQIIGDDLSDLELLNFNPFFINNMFALDGKSGENFSFQMAARDSVGSDLEFSLSTCFPNADYFYVRYNSAYYPCGSPDICSCGSALCSHEGNNYYCADLNRCNCSYNAYETIYRSSSIDNKWNPAHPVGYPSAGVNSFSSSWTSDIDNNNILSVFGLKAGLADSIYSAVSGGAQHSQRDYILGVTAREPNNNRETRINVPLSIMNYQPFISLLGGGPSYTQNLSSYLDFSINTNTSDGGGISSIKLCSTSSNPSQAGEDACINTWNMNLEDGYIFSFPSGHLFSGVINLVLSKDDLGTNYSLSIQNVNPYGSVPSSSGFNSSHINNRQYFRLIVDDGYDAISWRDFSIELIADNPVIEFQNCPSKIELGELYECKIKTNKTNAGERIQTYQINNHSNSFYQLPNFTEDTDPSGVVDLSYDTSSAAAGPKGFRVDIANEFNLASDTERTFTVYTLPSVTTLNHGETNIGSSNFYCSLSVTDSGHSEVSSGTGCIVSQNNNETNLSVASANTSNCGIGTSGTAYNSLNNYYCTKTNGFNLGGNKTHNVTGLTRNTNYYYRALAYNEAGISYGVTRNFHTKAAPASLSLSATVGASSINFNAQVLDTGGKTNIEDIVETVGFYWGSSSIPVPCNLANKCLISSLSGGSFSASISLANLYGSSNIRAFAINEDDLGRENTSYSTQYPLSINRLSYDNGGGTGTKSPTYHISGSTVALETGLNPYGFSRTGYEFSSWQPSNNIIMNMDITAVAQWSLISHTLNMSMSTGGASVSPGVGSHSINNGSTVNISATAQSGYAFNNWTGTNCPCSTNSSCSFTMNNNVSCNANFNIIRQLTLNKSEDYMGSVTSNVTDVNGLFINCGTPCNTPVNFNYLNNTNLTLTATAGSSYLLSGWSGCDSTSGDQCTVNMNSNKTVTANFESNNYILQLGAAMTFPDLLRIGVYIDGVLTYNFTSNSDYSIPSNSNVSLGVLGMESGSCTRLKYGTDGTKCNGNLSHPCEFVMDSNSSVGSIELDKYPGVCTGGFGCIAWESDNYFEICP